MNIRLLIAVLFFVKKSSAIQPWNSSDFLNIIRDAKLNFSGLAYKYGLRTEEHDVVTEDGYILKLFRIPCNGRPVLLQHGFQDSADIYILKGNTSLSAMLFNSGYDVWLGNVRGNKYSRRHTTLNPDKDNQFWDFSLHEHGYYDTASMVDFILHTTGRSKLDYIGHSQGTTVMFILGATRPEYNEKVGVFIAMAPVVFLQNVNPILKTFFQFAPSLNQLLRRFNKEELNGPNSIEARLSQLCIDPVIGYLCLNLIIFPFAGANPAEFEAELITIFFSHYPSGSSRKNLNHFAQIGRSGYFAHYDYKYENFCRYGSMYHPRYELARVTMPTTLIVSKNDGFSSIQDTNRLKAILPNVIEYFIVEPPLFNHIDFLLGRKTYLDLYPKILKILQAH